ncbi:MAG: c-type cytochrome [Caldilinea sp.]
MKQRSLHPKKLIVFSLLLTGALLTGACRNDAVAEFPTSTPIAVFTPWPAQSIASTPSVATEPAAYDDVQPITAPTTASEPTAVMQPTLTPAPVVTSAPTDTPTAEPTATAELTPVDEMPESQTDPALGDNLLPPEIAGLLATANPATGEQLTVSNGCIACHSLQEGVVTVGPSWYNLGEIAATRVEGESAKVYLYHSIVDPNGHLVEGFLANLMPAVYKDTLTPTQLADIIAYLLDLGAE